jgi:hypothetical protein
MRGGEFLGLKWDAIFEEFRQVGTADKKVQGTGLDWSRQFIELDGGRVWVKSQLGQDSTFTLLPVRREKRAGRFGTLQLRAQLSRDSCRINGRIQRGRIPSLRIPFI